MTSKKYSILPMLVIILCSCTTTDNKKNIADVILNERNSFYYIDSENYPQKNNKLPIGIFDSGTGGLTVLDAIVNFDKHNNSNKTFMPNGDNIEDFISEYFIYLGDHANMPYGEYSSHNKTDLLKEHIYKDVQFLLGNKYYKNPGAEDFSADKEPVKAIVIACNTATAYGKKEIEEFLLRAGLDIKVIGVIDAGVRGALQVLNDNGDASVGVMATYGTVCSEGYPSTLSSELDKLNYSGDIEVFQQAGIGLAGAIDGSADFIDKFAVSPRDDYKGPSENHFHAVINKKILDRYGFDWSGNNMLYTGEEDNPQNIQINSVENYISYHVVSLMEQIIKSANPKLLKSVILGCTHYPFFTAKFKEKFNRLYNYSENDQYIYRDFMSENIILVDPSINAALELFDHLKKNDLFNDSEISKSEFYISVPNIHNKNIVTDGKGNFTYEYKYGRNTSEIQEYVKVVPFSRNTIDHEVISRLFSEIPYTYDLISRYNSSNAKTKFLQEEEKL